MSFTIYYQWGRGYAKEGHCRVDDVNEAEAIAKFKRCHPRRKITKVIDITNLVRNLGISCY